MNAPIPARAVGPMYALDAAEYHAIDALGSSDVKELATRSPAHFRARRAAGDTRPTDAQVRGTATHLAVLEPARYDSAVAVIPADAPDRPTAAMIAAKDPTPASRRRVEYWREFDAQVGGRLVVSAEVHDAVRRMADSVQAHPAARELLSVGVPEVSLLWIDPDTSAQCKARIDWLRPEVAAVDLKTTRNASRVGFKREIAQLGYHLQAAHYGSGARCALGQAFEFWTWIAVEPEPPYAVGVYAADPDDLARAFEIVERAYALHEHCRASNTWPAYSPLIEPITLPPWAF